MANSLLKILAASVGGGIVLGAGIRLGEAIASQLPAPGSEAGEKLARRLDELEDRLTILEVGPEVGNLPSQPAAPAPAEGVREELRSWIEDSVTARMAEVETRLRAESERGQKEILDAFAESVETRVLQRISRLEDEVANQSAAMAELRDCSLRTEMSVHKLLGGLDRLIPKTPPAPVEESASPQAAEPASERSRKPAPPEPVPPRETTGPEAELAHLRQVKQTSAKEEPAPPAPFSNFTPPARPRRWKLFS